MYILKNFFKMFFLVGTIFVSVYLMGIGASFGYLMTSAILVSSIFTILWCSYKFENELYVFFNPRFSESKLKGKRKRKKYINRKVIKKTREKLKKFKEKQEKKKAAFVFLTTYVNNMEKFGVVQISTIVGLIITGLKFVVFHYAKSIYEGKNFHRFFHESLYYVLNQDLFLSSVLVIYFAIIFYIYKTNFIFQCRLIQQNDNNSKSYKH